MGIAAAFMIMGVLLAIAFGIYNIFEKAGEPGWQAFIPIYNVYRLFKVAGLPGWWMLGLFFPFINLLAYFALGKNLAERFGRSAGFALGVCLFPWAFLPILGYSDDVYTPPEGTDDPRDRLRNMTEYDDNPSIPQDTSYYDDDDDFDDDDIDDDGIERIPLEDW